MPYLNDPRRTVTLNFFPDEYDALSEDALEAGYATPGTFAKALVLARGEPTPPLPDRRGSDRFERLQAGHTWLLHQFEAVQVLLRHARIPFKFGDLPAGEHRPRSRAAQVRAVEAAVATALEQERAQVARRAARRKAERAAARGATGAIPPSPAGPQSA